MEYHERALRLTQETGNKKGEGLVYGDLGLTYHALGDQAVCVTTHKGSWVHVLHFNRDTIEYASRERDESKPGIKTPHPFLKNIREESDLENFQDLIEALDACYLLQKAISISLSRRFGDDRRCKLADLRWRFPASQRILCTVWR